MLRRKGAALDQVCHEDVVIQERAQRERSREPLLALHHHELDGGPGGDGIDDRPEWGRIR